MGPSGVGGRLARVGSATVCVWQSPLPEEASLDRCKFKDPFNLLRGGRTLCRRRVAAERAFPEAVCRLWIVKKRLCSGEEIAGEMKAAVAFVSPKLRCREETAPSC